MPSPAHPATRPVCAPRRLVVGRRPRHVAGVAAAVLTLLAVGACGSQKALTPPATPPPVAVVAPTAAVTAPPATDPTHADLMADLMAGPVVTGDSTAEPTPPPTLSVTSIPRTTAPMATTTQPAPRTSTTTKAAAPTAPKVPATPPTAAPVANKTSVANLAPVTGCGNPNPGKVLLTFDDGGPRAPDILAVLDRYGIKARWFPTGQWAAANAPFMARLVAGGQLTGNHSYSHPQMLSTLGVAELTRQVDLGYHPTTVFRFPYGANDDTSRGIVTGKGYSICGWNIDTLDWKGNSADTITSVVTSQARPGAVVLMHQSFQADVDALPRIIDNLRGRGLI